MDFRGQDILATSSLSKQPEGSLNKVLELRLILGSDSLDELVDVSALKH